MKRGILWLRGGAISAKEEQISIFVVLPRPKSRASGQDRFGESAQSQEPQSVASQESVSSQESPSVGVIERSIGPGQFVSSSFRCQVGDVIVLEGGGRLWLRKKGDIEPRDICLLALLYRVELKDQTPGESKV